MKTCFHIALFYLTVVELLFAFPLQDEVTSNVTSENNEIVNKITVSQLKPQKIKGAKQDEEAEDGGGEGGIQGYAGGLVNRLVGFAGGLLKEDITFGKVLAGAATFIPGQAGEEVGNIFDRIAKPFNVLLEQPLQRVQDIILGTPNPLNATNQSTLRTTDVQNISNAPGTNQQVPVPVSNTQAVYNPTLTNLQSSIPAKSPVLTNGGVSNTVQAVPATIPVTQPAVNFVPAPVVQSQPNYYREPLKPLENIPAPANEINGEEEDGDDNDDEDSDNAKAKRIRI